MDTPHQENNGKSTRVSTNHRLVTILLVLLIVLVVLIIIGIIVGFLMMGRMMGGGMMMGGNLPLVTESNGAHIYKTGVNARGEAIQNSMMPGMGGCAMCHGTDGNGSQMMGQVI